MEDGRDVEVMTVTPASCRPPSLCEKHDLSIPLATIGSNRSTMGTLSPLGQLDSLRTRMRSAERGGKPWVFVLQGTAIRPYDGSLSSSFIPAGRLVGFGPFGAHVRRGQLDCCDGLHGEGFYVLRDLHNPYLIVFENQTGVSVNSVARQNRPKISSASLPPSSSDSVRVVASIVPSSPDGGADVRRSMRRAKSGLRVRIARERHAGVEQDQ